MKLRNGSFENIFSFYLKYLYFYYKDSIMSGFSKY